MSTVKWEKNSTHYYQDHGVTGEGQTLLDAMIDWNKKLRIKILGTDENIVLSHADMIWIEGFVAGVNSPKPIGNFERNN